MISSSAIGRTRIFRILTICLLFPLLFNACGTVSPNKDILSYQANNFHISVRGELRGAPFQGEVIHVKVPSTEEESYCLTFTSPAPLAGIAITTDSRGAFVSLGDLSVPADTWDTLLWTDVLHLFSLEGAPLTITSEKNAQHMVAVYLTEEGKSATVTLDTKTEKPIWIETDGIWIEILSFQ